MSPFTTFAYWCLFGEALTIDEIREKRKDFIELVMNQS